MNLTELKWWIASAQYVECASDEYDGNTNHDVENIYRKDGEFFRISFLNDHPYSRYDSANRRFVYGEYEPMPVEKHTWMEERHEWKSKEII